MELNGFNILLAVIGAAITGVLANKKGAWGLLPLLLPLGNVLYWSRNPIQEGHMPTMTALNMFPWLFILVLYIVVCFISLKGETKK